LANAQATISYIISTNPPDHCISTGNRAEGEIKAMMRYGGYCQCSHHLALFTMLIGYPKHSEAYRCGIIGCGSSTEICTDFIVIRGAVENT
jgi:hypothetical protein